MAALEDRKVLVTGAGQGIGAAIVEQADRQGARIFAIDINGGALREIADKSGSVNACRIDVTDSGAVARLHAEIGEIDVLFNVAGYVHHGTILDCSEADWRKSMDVNLTSMYLFIRRFLPGMLEKGHGNIINMASVVSTIKAVPSRFAYSASKGGVIALTKSVAADFVKQGIRCNAICPGTIDTPSLHERLKCGGDYESMFREFVNRQPMQRLGTAQEIASLAMYLASDSSDYITGTAIVCDGGMSL